MVKVEKKPFKSEHDIAISKNGDVVFEGSARVTTLSGPPRHRSNPPRSLYEPYYTLPGSSGGRTQRSFNRSFSLTAGPVRPEPLSSALPR